MMAKMNRMTALTLAAGLAMGTSAFGQTVNQAEPITEVVTLIETVTVENIEAEIAAIPIEQPVIEVVFVLDTTGSMSGLLQGAKEKIWSIANAIATAEPTPDIKIGLVGYRDRGDAYITVRTAMTTDLDSIFSDLMKYQAGGGGDGPESVNQALNEAVTAFEWSSDANALKLIYLVGDAPPHMDYQDDVRYHDSCAIAAEAGIIINTIQCGNMGGTDVIWQEIARLSEGEYFAIDQTGGMLAVATPYDAELARLGVDLDSTLVAYGDEEEKLGLYTKLETGREIDASAPASARADRARYKAGEAGADSLTGRQELIRDIAEGKANLNELKDEELPEIMQKMTPEERVAYVKTQQVKRDQLRQQITEIDGRRQAYLKEALGKKADGFDQKVMVALRLQAAKKGIVYKVPDEEPDEEPTAEPKKEGSKKDPKKDDK